MATKHAAQPPPPTAVGPAAQPATGIAPPAPFGPGPAGAVANLDPYPIPWLDKNRHHNQVPAPDGPPTELAHVFHFAGDVARALLRGSGRTADGQELSAGTGTDFGFVRGRYVSANGTEQIGAFVHI